LMLTLILPPITPLRLLIITPLLLISHYWCHCHYADIISCHYYYYAIIDDTLLRCRHFDDAITPLPLIIDDYWYCHYY
jgi:hypothetical protein